MQFEPDTSNPGTLRAVGPGSGVLRGARLPARLVALHDRLGPLDAPTIVHARHAPGGDASPAPGWQRYDAVLMPWDEMLRSRAALMSEGQSRVLDFAYEYLGMGHVRVHFVDTAVGLAYTRRDGGSNGFERNERYSEVLRWPAAAGDCPSFSKRSRLLSEVLALTSEEDNDDPLEEDNDDDPLENEGGGPLLGQTPSRRTQALRAAAAAGAW